MGLISMFPGGGGGGGIDLASKPEITFDGNWLPWHIELYNDAPYWEAWFLSSGTLSVTGNYTADAWMIGGGGGTRSVMASGSGGGGHVTQAANVVLQGTIPVTIGAGGLPGNKGGETSFLTTTASGGNAGAFNTTPYSDPNRYRFSDAYHENEIGDVGVGTRDYAGGGGWQHFRSYEGHGEGYGAGAGFFSVNSSSDTNQNPRGHAGALVIRIPI